MRKFRTLVGVALAVGSVSAIGLVGHSQPPVTVIPRKAPGVSRDADREAILASSRDFAAAFNAGDAKAIAGQWTEQGECRDGSGETVQGRAAIEKAFASFFKDHPKAKIDVLVRSIRFPANDLAIEEGLLRQLPDDKGLPTSTAYSVAHVREGGKWLSAVSREWGAGKDRLEDLDWLLGEWKAGFQGREVTLTFTRDPKKPVIMAEFTRKEPGKEPVTGTIRILSDPETGRLRSWHFDEDGGHGQALWVRDGDRWVLDSLGVTADGAKTAGLNVIGRLTKDAILWRSIDRKLDGRAIPDTVPVRLTRTSAVK